MSMIEFRVNGRHVRTSSASPFMTVLDYLRNDLGLVGTKEGCAEGDCGACTILLLDRVGAPGARWRPVNSCLLPLAAVHGRDLITIEGLASGDRLHPAQRAVVDSEASQCGYCTPGVVLTLAAAAHQRPDAAEAVGEAEILAGNLCRCTGYGPIRAALKETVASDPDDRLVHLQALPELAAAGRVLEYRSGSTLCLRPRSWAGLWAAMEAYPGCSLVAGATDWTLEHGGSLALSGGSGVGVAAKAAGRSDRAAAVSRVQNRVEPGQTRGVCVVFLEDLPDFRRLQTLGAAGWAIGAGTSVAGFAAAIGPAIPAVARLLRYFGSAQIRNRGTVGGNLCTASPVGDLAPLLLALDARVVLRSRSGSRTVPVREFFLDYRRTILHPGEILGSILLPRPHAETLISAFKVCKRREVDIATLSCVVALAVDSSGVIRDARIAFGGMAPMPVRVPACEEALEGQPFADETFARAAAAATQALEPISDQRGSAWYRRQVAANLIRAFYAEWRNGSPPPWLESHPGAVAVAPLAADATGGGSDQGRGEA
jgi:xanthine dehydrogenase iron-sulfur cluster and FAD-binding subunit A